jgi:hypothetical protein
MVGMILLWEQEEGWVSLLVMM